MNNTPDESHVRRPVIQFRATIPDIMSAMNLSGYGHSRLKLDIPQSELPQVLELMKHGRERVLNVTIEPE